MSTGSHTKEDVMQDQILLAAQQLFQKYGLHKVTMDDVAKAIGKHRSSLYYYYKSKEEILDAVKDIEIREIIAEVTEAVDNATDAEQKIKAFCATMLKISQKRRALYNTMDVGMNADELSNYTKVKQVIHKRFMKQQSILLNRILSYGIENAQLRALNEADQEELVFVLLSSLYGLKREMSMENEFDKIELAVNSLTNMIIHGLKS